jgi:DNA-binding GntR family transcriptional regulator
VEYEESTKPRRSQVERVYDEIRSRILYGRYRPAAHLSEATLARVHRASRTPVREALSRLCEEGLVVADPGRGFIIAPISLNTVRNMFEVRRLLEGSAAEGAAARATDEEIARMCELAIYEYRPGDQESYRLALTRNVEFHVAVANGTHNGLLVGLVRNCLTLFDRVLSLGANFQSFHEPSSPEHIRIANAIKARDAQASRAAAEHHVERASRLMMDVILSGGVRGVTV